MPDGAWGSKEPSPLERLVAAREAEKNAQRKKDTRVLTSLALAAVVLVGGGVFAWLRLTPPSWHHTRTLAATKPAATTTARSAPTVSLPGLTSPVDANGPPADPFSGTPAEHWANGAAGIAIPAVRAHGPYSAARVRSAYETTREMLIAGNLDWPTLRGGAPKSLREAADQIGTKTVPGRAAQHQGGQERGGREYARVDYHVRPGQREIRHHGGQRVHPPRLPERPADTVRASGKPVNPYALATPSAGAACQNTTGT
jgi:hypothetical protein